MTNQCLAAFRGALPLATAMAILGSAARRCPDAAVPVLRQVRLRVAAAPRPQPPR